MKLDLTEILANVGMQYPYEVNVPPIVDEDLECRGRIRGDILFTNTGNALLLRGEVKANVTLPCSRCLVYYDEPVAVPVEEQFAMEVKSGARRSRILPQVVDDEEN